MAFAHGSLARVYVNGFDVSAYLQTASVAKSADTAETTTFQSAAKTYIAGLTDATFSLDGLFDRTAGASDVVLNAALGTDSQIITVLPAGDTIPATGYGGSGYGAAYDVQAGIGDAVKVSASVQSAVGAEAVTSQHALASRTTSGTATVVDVGATHVDGTGYVAYLHCTAMPAGTVIVKLQDSADNSTYADISGATFTNLTTASANTAQRLATAGTVRRYTRAVWTATSGTATFWCGLGRFAEL